MQDEQDTDEKRLRFLADKLGCMTEEDLQLLTETTPITVQGWRKRGKAPPSIRAGNRHLYPLAGVAKWLEERMRAPRTAEFAKDML